jgi:hypothetical protein
MNTFLLHWKTTVAGILSAILGIVPAGSAFLGGLQALYAQQPGHGPADYRLAIWGMALSFVAAVARVWIGLLQNDAPAPPTAPAIPLSGTSAGSQPFKETP